MTPPRTGVIAGLAAVVLAAPLHAAAPRASAPPFEPRVALELRLGVQVPTPSAPSLGVLLSITEGLDWIVGYELLRVWDRTILTSGDTAEGPLIMSAVRLGAARRFLRPDGWFTRGAVLLGVASDAVSLARLPSDLAGRVAELTLDGTAGYSGRIGRIGAFLATTGSWGEVHTSFETASGVREAKASIHTVSFATVSFAAGLSLAVHF